MRNKKTNRRGYKGKANRERDCTRTDKTDEKVSDKTSDPANDISWYSRYPNLLVAAGSIPYPYRPGMSVPLGTRTINNVTAKQTTAIPGLLQINWAPTLGASTNQTSPASIVGKEIYNKVRAAFSGGITADAPDFIVYLGALDSIFSYIAWLKRTYRIVSAWSPENYYMPDGVLKTIGFTDASIQGLRQNKMQLFQVINELILMTRKFRCPAVMDYFNRHYWMNDHIYVDAPMANSQMFIFNQSHYYRFAMLAVPGGSGIQAGGLNCVPFWDNITQGANIVKSLFDFGRSLINALAASEDAYTISGYLKRAYEGSPDFVVAELLMDEKVQLDYVPEVLSQIENAWCVLSGFDTAFVNTVVQDPSTNNVICGVTIDVPATDNRVVTMAQNAQYLISARSETPTVAETVIATRLKNGIASISGAGDTRTLSIDVGTELLTGLQFNDGVTPTSSFRSELFDQSLASLAVFASSWSKFDWAPMLALSSTSSNFYTILSDYHNVTSIDSSTLENLHTVCVYSELNAFEA